MISKAQAAAIAQEWIAAWNAHDLPRILGHYTEDFSMSSPFIAEVAGEPSGTLHGKAAVGAYWEKALSRMPDLHFELLDVLTSADSVAIHYRNQRSVAVVEVLQIEAGGKVGKAAAHYSIGPNP